jgi:predicted ester cyclase
MTPDAMKAYVSRHFEQFVNAKNVDIADETLAASFLDHDGPEGKPIDRAGDKAMMRGMHARFPVLHVTIEDMIAEGDKVVCRNVWRATDGTRRSSSRAS